MSVPMDDRQRAEYLKRMGRVGVAPGTEYAVISPMRSSSEMTLEQVARAFRVPFHMLRRNGVINGKQAR